MSNRNLLILAVIVILIVIFWNNIKSFFSTKPTISIPPCTMPDGTIGVLVNGVCTQVDTTGGPGPVIGGTQRTSQVTSSGNTILIPATGASMGYTAANPYTYQGNRYSFVEFVNTARGRFASLRRIDAAPTMSGERVHRGGEDLGDCGSKCGPDLLGRVICTGDKKECLYTS